MRKALATMVLLAALGGCGQADRTARDVGNASDAIGQAAGDIGNAADALSGNADTIADRLTNRAAQIADRAADRLDNVTGDAANMTADAAQDALPAASSLATDRWVGRWRGVEGLNLVIEKDRKKGAGHYILRNTWSLDDKGVFEGVADGRSIRFERPDGDQMLRHTDGEATGLKWLAGKADCLTVRDGEGYCRD